MASRKIKIEKKKAMATSEHRKKVHQASKKHQNIKRHHKKKKKSETTLAAPSISLRLLASGRYHPRRKRLRMASSRKYAHITQKKRQRREALNRTSRSFESHHIGGENNSAVNARRR